MKPIYFACLVLTASLVLSSCNLSAPQQDPNAISTAAAQTVEAALSSAATSAPPQPLLGEPIPTQTVFVPPTIAPDCEDSATYTAWTRNNVTYDAKEIENRLAPNSTFTMSWTLQNTGTCTWNSIYQMYFDSGTPLTYSANTPILPYGEFVSPGGTVTVEIEMTAPAQVGDYESTFRLQNDHSESVINLGVLTKVGDSTKAGGTSSTSLPNPGDLKYAFECPPGVVNISLFWVDKASDEDGYRVYRDGTKVAELPSGSTSYGEIALSAGINEYTVSAFNASEESASKVSVDTSICK